MTRVEISICSAALEKFRPDLPSVRTLWHLKMQNAIDLIINKVLNHKDILPLVYRKLSLPILLGSLGLCSYNLMVIGRRYSWIVNAQTSHSKHFVGTRYILGLPTKTVNN